MTGRTTRRASGALAALCALALVACGDAPGTGTSGTTAVTAPGDSSGVSIPLDTAPDGSDTTIATTIGWSTARYAVEGDAAAVADAAMARLHDAGLDGEARVDGADVVVEIHHISETDATLLLHSVLATSAQVWVRAVGAPCAELAQPLTAPVVADPTSRQLVPVAMPGSPLVCEVEVTTVTGAIFAGDAAITDIPGAGTGLLVSLRPGADGLDQWNSLANDCYQRLPLCGTGQLAVEVGGVLVTVATVQTPTFDGSVQLAGSFTPATAAVLAAALNAPAGPAATVVSSSFTPA